MTDQDVLVVLDRLEAILAAPLEHPNGQAIADWHEAFKRAVAQAERGPRWPEVQARARLLGRLLKRREALIQDAQKSLRLKLGKYSAGRVALQAYGRG
jgi:hypothetical protein